MNIRDLIIDNQTYLKYFDYYKKIGYTDNQSFILSVFPYNNYNRGFLYFLKKYYKEDLTENLSDYLMNLILKEYEKNKNIIKDISNVFEKLPEYKKYVEEMNLKQESSSVLDTLFCTAPSPELGFLSSQTFISGPILRGSSSSLKKSVKNIESMELAQPSNMSMAQESCLFADNEDSEDEGLDCYTFPSDGVEIKEVDIMEKLSTDSYETIEEKGFRNVLTSPTSTFRMTSNTAAFGILRKNKRRAIDGSMVRIEEILNNFEYDLSKPIHRMFNIITEVCQKPNSDNKLLFVGVQGKDIIPTRQNITLLLDVSGSMASHNKNTQLAMLTILSKLNDNDVLSLVTYSNSDSTIFENQIVDTKTIRDIFIKKLYNISISGCTYGSKGIETAYNLAKRTYIKDGINRVILMTDGDLNFGITSKGKLKDFILDKKDDGIFLSVLGIGLYNYRDDVLETLSKNGNGNYCTIDCIEDIEENILNKYNSLVFTIAKDVKAQIEFNPKLVKEYRLIGYENRSLNHEDFKDDNVISEPFGCGSYGVALYELVMKTKKEDEMLYLEYQTPILNDSKNICTVKVRYKEPLKDESSETSVRVKNKDNGLTNNLLLAYTIYVICEKLRGSKFIKDENLRVLDKIKIEKELGMLYIKNKDKIETLIDLY